LRNPHACSVNKCFRYPATASAKHKSTRQAVRLATGSPQAGAKRRDKNILNRFFGSDLRREIQAIADNALRGDGYAPPARGGARQRALLGSLANALNGLKKGLHIAEEQVQQLEGDLSATKAEFSEVR